MLWAAVILFLTLLPAASLPEVPGWQFVSFTTASHAVVFFILALLLQFGLTKQTTFTTLRRHSSWFTLIASLLFGILIEFLQTQMKMGRQGDPMDVVSNSIGTLIGIFLFTLVCRRLLPNFF